MKKGWRLGLLAVLVLAVAFALYVGRYYHADETAAEALVSDEAVLISQTDYGWLFDGPAEDRTLIFYPGAKVEETAYAPLLHTLAAAGVDVCLVRMPLRFAVLDTDRAEAVMQTRSCPHWYIGGHSLGGACASLFAAKNADRLDGVIFLGSYPDAQLEDDLRVLLLRGSEDRVLNLARYQKALPLANAHAVEYVIEGGNHAQFGSYGEQRGDGEATISADEQIEQSVRDILAGLGIQESVPGA